MEDCILKINLIVFITLTIFYLYQFIYVAVVLLKAQGAAAYTVSVSSLRCCYRSKKRKHGHRKFDSQYTKSNLSVKADRYFCGGG